MSKNGEKIDNLETLIDISFPPTKNRRAFESHLSKVNLVFDVFPRKRPYLAFGKAKFSLKCHIFIFGNKVLSHSNR